MPQSGEWSDHDFPALGSHPPAQIDIVEDDGVAWIKSHHRFEELPLDEEAGPGDGRDRANMAEFVMVPGRGFRFATVGMNPGVGWSQGGQADVLQRSVGVEERGSDDADTGIACDFEHGFEPAGLHGQDVVIEEEEIIAMDDSGTGVAEAGEVEGFIEVHDSGIVLDTALVQEIASLRFDAAVVYQDEFGVGHGAVERDDASFEKFDLVTKGDDDTDIPRRELACDLWLKEFRPG